MVRTGDFQSPNGGFDSPWLHKAGSIPARLPRFGEKGGGFDSL